MALGPGLRRASRVALNHVPWSSRRQFSHSSVSFPLRHLAQQLLRSPQPAVGQKVTRGHGRRSRSSALELGHLSPRSPSASRAHSSRDPRVSLGVPRRAARITTSGCVLYLCVPGLVNRSNGAGSGTQICEVACAQPQEPQPHTRAPAPPNRDRAGGSGPSHAHGLYPERATAHTGCAATQREGPHRLSLARVSWVRRRRVP